MRYAFKQRKIIFEMASGQIIVQALLMHVITILSFRLGDQNNVHKTLLAKLVL
jgi:hypothetical protein